MMPLSKLFYLVVLFVVISASNAFVCQNCFKHSKQVGSQLRYSNYGSIDENDSNKGGKKNESDRHQDLNFIRDRLEGLVATEDSPNEPLDISLRNWQEQLDNPPPLTSIRRERIEAEIMLLESLSDSDDAMENLWNLWRNSRGPSAAEELKEIDLLFSMGGYARYNAAESKLRKLIDKEGIYFVEAVYRLATILFLQGRFKESKEMCNIVLTIKPWHVGALSAMVMVCQGLNDTTGLAYWSSQTMPIFPEQIEEETIISEEREEWVDKMLYEAEKRLRIEEERLKESYTLLDYNEKSRNNIGRRRKNNGLYWQ